MNVFQSWADIAIMLVLAIAYIWTTIAQAKVINAKNETIRDLTTRNQELDRVRQASSDLANNTAKELQTFKGMFDFDLLKQYMEIHIKVEVDRVKSAAEQQAAHDKRMIESMNDHLNEAISYLAFMLHVERKYTRDQRIKFFHLYFDKGKDLFWYITNQKIEKVEKAEKQKNQIQSATPDVSNTPDVSG